MALVFDKQNIAIKFFSDKILDNNLKKELILYPVIGYKIYAPLIDDLDLNIFQKYILSIFNKGNFTLDEVSGWLNLDIILVKTIAVELANKYLINIDTFNITQKGKDLIDGSFSWFNNAEKLKKDIQYIFQDIFTEELYPIILPFDNFQQNIWLEKDQLKVGSKGKNTSFKYNLIKPDNINLRRIRKPDIGDVLDAFQKMVRKFIPDSKNDLKDVPNAVSYLGDEPDLFYCGIWITSELKNKNEENIMVSDPFNIYENPFWLRNTILKAKEQNDILKNIVHNIIFNIDEEAKMEASSFMIDFDKELDKELDLIFDFSLKNKYEMLHSAIREYYFNIKFYQVHRKASHLKNAFRDSQIVLETLFKIIFEKYKDDYLEVIDSQTYNGGQFHAYKSEIIAKITKINKEVQIPNWRHPEFKDVFSALKNPDKASLRALFIAAIMAAFYNNRNPIYNLLVKKINTAVCIENIAESRNKFGHKYVNIPDEEIDNYYEDVIVMQQDVEEIIKIFLEK